MNPHVMDVRMTNAKECQVPSTWYGVAEYFHCDYYWARLLYRIPT